MTIYKLMNNLQETDRKDLILRRKVEARYLRTQEKIAKRNLFERYKKLFFPKKYRYLEWTKGRDNGKECTSTE